MPHDRDTHAARPANNRSAVSNGRSWFVPATMPDGSRLDTRTAAGRRFVDIASAIADDLGGMDMLSEGQRQLIRRAAALSIQCELLEARFAARGAENGELQDFNAATNTLRRVLDTIGLHRQARDVTPSALEWIDQQAAKRKKAEA